MMDSLHVISTDNAIAALAADREAIQSQLKSLHASLPSPSYSLPMLWRCAMRISNDIVDHVPRYSSADHGTVFKCLIAAARRTMHATGSEFYGPFFDIAREHDPRVQQYLIGEHQRLARLDAEVSFKAGYWRLTYNSTSDEFRVSLAPAVRRSALTLLDHKVEFETSESDVQEALRSGDTIALALATGMREFKFLADALPTSWARLSSKLGFSIDDALHFIAFYQSLMSLGKVWFDYEDLERIFLEHGESAGWPSIPPERVKLIVDFFSASPEELESWGVVAPFVRFDKWLAYWPFTHHVLPPSLTFITLLLRKFTDDWSNTFGAELAAIADTVAKGLNVPAGILMATTRAKSQVGDIDLALYDESSGVLVLCEIKTVFDRFRTNYQLTNFTDQRVNFEKAAAQLEASRRSILEGRWEVSEIFGRRVDGAVQTILPVVLTWYDQHNPWLGTNSDIQSCNFRVFTYLFKKAKGDLVLLHDSLRQIARVYCAAGLSDWPLVQASEPISVGREIQTDALPPDTILDGMPLSAFVRDELRSLTHFPVDWEEQLRDPSMKDVTIVFYEFDAP